MERAFSSRYKAVVFDMDGTLIDSPLCFETIRRELEIPKESYILEYLSELERPEREKKMKRLEEIEHEASKSASAFPGVVELLSRLRHAGMKIGIFTRNCGIATSEVIQTLGLSVDHVVTREDAPPKPNPEGLVRFLNLWKLERHEVLYVGDFRFDIECGKSVGVTTALFTNGQSLPDTWNSDHVFHSYAEFERILI